MRPRRRRAAVSLVALALVGAVSGCDSGATIRRTVPTSTTVITDDPALDAARTAFTRARATVLSDIGAVTGAASALDALDAQAAKGAFDPAERAQPAAVKKAAAARAALGRLSGALTTYQAGAAMLTAVAGSPGLTPAQAAALRALVAAAGAEIVPARAFAAAQRGGWSAYDELAAAQALWLMRADDGFYPHSDDDTYDATRAGEAYVVLVNPGRAALTKERTALVGQTAAINTARAATEAALAGAGAAFR